MFLPLVAIIWTILLVMGIWMYNLERELKVEVLRQQVAVVIKRVIAAYENNDDPRTFLNFVETYYIDHPDFDAIEISTYYKGKLAKYTGRPIDNATVREINEGSNIKFADDPDRYSSHPGMRDNYYYDMGRSADGRLAVYARLPFDAKVVRSAKTTNDLFVLVLAMAAIGTILAFAMSRRLGRNIRLLSDFAERAQTDPKFVPDVQFSDDELGDISRHLVQFHAQRNASIIKLKREHDVALHAIEEKSRIKRDLTNNINHELKTPIAVIKGYLDTIHDHPDMDEDSRRHFLSKVSEHVDRLSTLLNDISNITRLEYGAQMINTEPIDFHEVVFQAVSDFETSGMLGKMIFNYDVPTYCRVVGNHQLLTGLLSNLTKNAVAYSHGTECNLVLTGEDPECYHFAFYDDGTGVRPESIPHLFERFFREDSGRSRKRGGTGLGLSIVQSTVEALGGTITAENRQSGGLLFRFTLKKSKD